MIIRISFNHAQLNEIIELSNANYREIQDLKIDRGQAKTKQYHSPKDPQWGHISDRWIDSPTDRITWKPL